jgi:hypothetical protein
MNSMTDAFTAARAAALFVSDVSVADHPTEAEVDDAIRRSLRTHGGSRGCAADLAAAYGDCPELAAPRMRWALGVVESRYARPATPAVHRRGASIRIDRLPAPAADQQLVNAA